MFVDFLLGWLDWRRNTSRSVYFSTLVSHLAVLVVNVVASNLLRVSHSCRLLRLDNPAAMAAECRSLLRFPALRLELPRKTPEINAQPALSESTYVRICELVCSHLVSAFWYCPSALIGPSLACRMTHDLYRFFTCSNRSSVFESVACLCTERCSTSVSPAVALLWFSIGHLWHLLRLAHTRSHPCFPTFGFSDISTLKTRFWTTLFLTSPGSKPHMASLLYVHLPLQYRLQLLHCARLSPSIQIPSSGQIALQSASAFRSRRYPCSATSAVWFACQIQLASWDPGASA